MSDVLESVPERLRPLMTSLPVFYILEYLGRNPGTWENVGGFAHRIGLSEHQASEALEMLARQGILIKRSGSSEPLYVLSAEPQIRNEVMTLATEANRSHDQFLNFVRAVLRQETGGRNG